MSYDLDEVIHIKIKRCLDNIEPEYKKMSIDPHITTFDILRRLVSRAFNLTGDFTISYLAKDGDGRNIYLSMLSDWDLDAAFMGASCPFLNLKVELKNINIGMNDWPEDSRLVSRSKLTGGSVFQSISNAVSSVTKTFGLWNEIGPEKLQPSVGTNPLADYDFRSFQDPVGNLTRDADFRLAVYKRGVETCLRKVVWRHLLNIYPRHFNGKQRIEYLHKKSEEYRQLRHALLSTPSSMSSERKKLLNSVRKDVLRTDRNHLFFAGSDENENLKSLFNLLVVYALTHPSVGYCQGMSDIASPLLYVQKDEAVAYLCFCSLMRRLRCNFSAEDDGPIITKFTHLSLVLRHHDQQLYDHLSSSQSDFFFCYRWILLEMKREFPLDETLSVLEIMWASLAPDPPYSDLPLFDPAYVHTHFPISNNSNYANFVNRRLSQMRRASSISGEVVSGTTDSIVNTLPSLESLEESVVTGGNEKPKAYSLCDACVAKASMFCPHSDFMTVKDPTGQTYLLPPPAILGHGNPFLMFLCVALLLQHRERILRLKWDYEDTALFFDRMVRKHDSIAVLRTARQMHDAYLKQHTASQTDQA